MTRTIWKYDIPVTAFVESVNMPEPSKIVHVGCQQPGVVTVWAEVTPGGEPSLRVFKVYGTGGIVDGTYVGTAHDRSFVWHLYAEDI